MITVECGEWRDAEQAFERLNYYTLIRAHHDPDLDTTKDRSAHPRAPHAGARTVWCVLIGGARPDLVRTPGRRRERRGSE